MFEIEVKFAEELSDEKLDDIIAAVEEAGGMIGGGGDEYVVAANDLAAMFTAVARVAAMAAIKTASFPCPEDSEFVELLEEQAELTN